MHCVLILVFLLLLIIPSATPLKFFFPSFSTQDTNTIFTEGDAYLDSESLRLTKIADAQDTNGTAGRATYKKPFLLRNKTTGELADFNTSFSFSINSQNNTKYGDGLAFFIAPYGSSLNVRLGVASSLGLPVNSSSTPTCEYPFVAVEFDIYRNNVTAIEDPSFSTIDDHVGIDVNSLKSRVTAPWNGGILTGERNTVTVRYDSSTNNLSVHFTDTFPSVKSISSTVNLTEFLPDRVIVGFSASTGGSIAMHKIISWNFTSSLDESPDAKPRNKNKIKLIVGMGVGGGIILVVVLALVFFIFRVNREMWGSEEDPIFTDVQFERETVPRQYSYRELALATSNFSDGKKLGNGGFGDVYRGVLKNSNREIAVKKIWKHSDSGPKEYAAEIGILSSLRHPNLVQLLGCSRENIVIGVLQGWHSGESINSVMRHVECLMIVGPWCGHPQLQNEAFNTSGRLPTRDPMLSADGDKPVDNTVDSGREGSVAKPTTHETEESRPLKSGILAILPEPDRPTQVLYRMSSFPSLSKPIPSIPRPALQSQTSDVGGQTQSMPSRRF
ncbi:hypothetical protein M0R45_000033 [Rubus argutus]|uniref:Protein kinase domain-containing protein n=1 Tax=Rubus argutus TaxID=59490 RepID=A0AAW1VSL8_RUBAR